MKDKTAELKVKFIEYMRQLPVQKLAADSIGRDETTISRWKKDDPDFANQIANAKSAWALENSKRVRSKEWLMERVMNDHFGNKLDITSGGEPIQAPILGGITKNDIQSNDSNTETSET